MSDTSEKKRSAVLLFNIAKRRNFGNLLRSADAFGVSEVGIVGRKRISTFGNHGTARHLRMRHYLTLREAVADFKARGFLMCGLEILDEAVAVEDHPFQGDTCFLLGNEGTGLSEVQRSACDYFVYIRQYGHGASLNVNVAGAIAFHHFALWAQIRERPMRGGKFLAELPGKAWSRMDLRQARHETGFEKRARP